MRIYNKIFLSLLYYVKEIMNDNGYEDNVIDSYLNDIDLAKVDSWPTVAINRGRYSGEDFEIGSQQHKAAYFMIDIFANSKTQRDDLTELLFDSLNEITVPLYDFDIGFPVTTGDYTGITRLGEVYIDNVSGMPLEPPEQTNIVGENNHAILDGIIHFV